MRWNPSSTRMNRNHSCYKYTKQINVYTSKLVTTLQRLLDEEVLAVETLVAALALFMDVLLS